MSGEAEHRTKVLRVATRCTSLDQFVEAFARYCEKRTLFVASLTTRSPGSQSPFVILLADGRLAGRLDAPTADEVAERLAHLGD